MNYTKKAEEVFAELFHESWMTASDWSHFRSRAEKIYPISDFAEDLESGYPGISIDAKLNEIKRRVKL